MFRKAEKSLHHGLCWNEGICIIIITHSHFMVVPQWTWLLNKELKTRITSRITQPLWRRVIWLAFQTLSVCSVQEAKKIYYEKSYSISQWQVTTDLLKKCFISKHKNVKNCFRSIQTFHRINQFDFIRLKQRKSIWKIDS